MLRKHGHEDAAADIDPSPLDQLAAAAVQGKLAFGPQAGAPTPRLRNAPDRLAPYPQKKLCAQASGFTLHADVCIPAGNTTRLEKLCRYAARPPIVDAKLSLTDDGQHVLYKFHRPFRDGSTHVVLSCQELIARLAALIPKPRIHLVTYHGAFAPAASYRDRIVPDPPQQHLEPSRCPKQPNNNTPDPVPRKRRPYSWAELMKRVYRFDVLICEHCGGKRKLLAAVLERDAIRKVLAHLGMPTEPPAIVSARSPPGMDCGLFA